MKYSYHIVVELIDNKLNQINECIEKSKFIENKRRHQISYKLYENFRKFILGSDDHIVELSFGVYQDLTTPYT
jgi:hypothetical protein